MQEEPQHANQSPFDHGLFFPDNGRRSTLDALRNAVAGSASLITCIGEEGHGKTMLCNILEKEISKPYVVISFPYSVESFDYVLQIIALKLNLNFSIKDNAMGSVHLLEEIARTLREQGIRLVILFDEAEKLYLATLERIRKMIDLVNEDGVLLQIILLGRMEFQTHIKQLALCTFKSAQELHLVLPPLTEEDTFQYLNFYMPQRPGFAKNIFSREVAAKILTVSHGNFRKINNLAEDSLRSSSYTADNTADDTSFMVLLEHVRDSDDLIAEKPPAYRLPFLFMQKKTVVGAGIILIAILLFLSVSREEKKPVSLSRPEKKQITAHPQPQQTAPNKKDIAQKPVPPVPPVAVVVPVIKPAPSAPVAAAEPVVKPVPSAPIPAAEPAVKPVPPAPVAAEEPAVKPIPPAPVAVAAVEPAVKPISLEIAPLVEKKSSETQVLIANKSPKRNVIPLLTAEPFTKNNELLLKEKKGLKANINGQLPQKSLAAGDRWLAGEKNDHFTVQLMVLAADQAGKKLKEIVRDKEHQKISEKFIVLKKTASPATFILFYGEYPTLTAAKNARDNLPQSLQKYTPYPVSIKGAVEKSKR